jgi:diguanylate cyclase (GGDEF)-like protein
MSPRAQRYVPFVLGATVILTLAIVLIRVRYELEMTRETVHLQTLLVTAASEIGAALQQGESAINHSAQRGEWRAWRLDDEVYMGADGNPPMVEATLRRVLGARTGSGSVLLLGPFATELGANVLVVASPVEDSAGRRAWVGSWRVVDDLMSTAAVAELMRAGYGFQLYDPAQASALYQTESPALESPIVVPLTFGASRLELRAAPRRLPTRFLSSTLLVLLAVILWLSYELRRGTALRNAVQELGEADRRRREINDLYGNALQSVASLESKLQLVSMYDTVTGLANRSSLIRRIDSNLESMRHSPHGALCVMAVGFDHMHHITNAFGAEFASRVLVIAAERVEFVLPSKELLFRTGDFNFAIVLPQTDTNRSELLAQKIVAEIEAPIALDSHTFMLRPSVGIAETESGYAYAETLLDRATTALGAVERDAQVRYCLFDSTAAKESVSRLQLEVDLDKAFEQNQFVLEYEPFVTPVTYTVAGFEALIRWDHPTEGRLSPGRFVPIAVQAGMSHRLNNWVIRESARQASLWRKAGYRDFFINFNLAAEAFMRPNLADEIGAVLAEFEIPGNHLIIELTESTLIQDIRGAVRALQRLGELGVGAWLDDFGTGYSSLSHLRALPIKGVKIDRSFIERIVIDARDAGFLKALIDLIGYLGLQSIAEGIETREQYELLSLTTCDLYQGFHFARSMPAQQAERWLNEAGRSLKRSVVL